MVNSVKALAHDTVLFDSRKVTKMYGQRGCNWGYLTDLAKAFDCILHDLLIAKLTVYGFDYQSLRIADNFLSNRHQRTKINNAFSHYFEVICRVPQGSVLVPYFSISISVTYFLT